MGMKKKFDVNKFIKTLITPKEHPMGSGSPSDYKNEFGLNTKKSVFSRITRIDTALEDSGYEKMLKPRGNYYPFSKVDNIEKDFIRLDKSFKYSPILHITDTPDPDDNLYHHESEYAYLSTKKSEYSFLLDASICNVNDDSHSNFLKKLHENNKINGIQKAELTFALRGKAFDLEIIEVFKNIKKKNIKKLSQKVLENIVKNYHYCKWIILNNSYIWGSDSEYKALMSKKILPPSLKKFFLPILKNKKKLSKQCGNEPSLIKEINSMIGIMKENRIKKLKLAKPRKYKLAPSTYSLVIRSFSEVWDYVK